MNHKEVSGYTTDRVAVIADIHGNAPALRAVLDEINKTDIDLVVSLGDATWGAQPEETRMLLESMKRQTIFVAGNGERALRELREGREGDERECWMRDHHSPETYAFVDACVQSAVISVAGLGRVRFCHGSPRSDIELITPGADRLLKVVVGPLQLDVGPQNRPEGAP